MEIYFGDANKIPKTIDSIRDTRLTATCCDGRWWSSERRARGARIERARAATKTAERFDARTKRCRAGWLEVLSEHEFVVASRGVLFVAPGGRAIVRAAILLSPREVCVSRDCWPVGHLAPSTYVVTHAKRASLRGLRSARALAPRVSFPRIAARIDWSIPTQRTGLRRVPRLATTRTSPVAGRRCSLTRFARNFTAQVVIFPAIPFFL